MLGSSVWKGRSERGCWEKSDRALAVQAATCFGGLNFGILCHICFFEESGLGMVVATERPSVGVDD